MKRIWLDFTVGVFVIIGLVALSFLAFRVGNLSGVSASSGDYRVHAEFDNIGSLKVGSPVKSAGIVVGKVAEIKLNNHNFRGVVVINLQKKYAFPADSEVGVLTSGVLGEQYLAINPGLDPESWADGDKVEYTQSAIVLEKLIGQFMLSFAGKKEAPAEMTPAAK